VLHLTNHADYRAFFCEGRGSFAILF